ncbi:putative ferric-chelate reductase 1 [Bombina bombina]|uniref:putative ferric-chelate reductase 1 n=1 Tax=Bombina bombina TaxID=8345 RepID=UPI00235A54B6|nr:putative ferric-chelate reductase 1 [Bombina bombina]
MASSLLHIVVLLYILTSYRVTSFSNGKVQAACFTMEPNHGTRAQTSPAPYNVTVSKTSYTNGERLTVTLSTNPGETSFKGFLIQARDNNNSALGMFEVSGSDVQTLQCTNAANTISHTSSDLKSSIHVTWVAPDSNVSDIQFRTTVVQQGNTYWLNVPSPKLTYTSSRGCRTLVSDALPVALWCIMLLMCALPAIL